MLRSLDSSFVCVGFRGPYAAADGSGLMVGFALAHLFLLNLGSSVSSGSCRSSEVWPYGYFCSGSSVSLRILDSPYRFYHGALYATVIAAQMPETHCKV